MEPRIQYAKTSDGVSIAFWTLGEGMPLVHTPFTFGHIQMEWQFDRENARRVPDAAYDRQWGWLEGSVGTVVEAEL